MIRPDKRETTLADVAERCARYPELWSFAEYCRLKQLGLRKQALAELEQFIGNLAADSDDDRRFEVVDLLFQIDEEAQVHKLLTHSLVSKVMRPVCEARILQDDQDPRPYRWLGFEDNWRRALELDPSDAIARRRWSETVWRNLNYALHELPVGALASVEEIEGLVGTLDRLSDGPGGMSDWPTSDLRLLACSYLDYSRSGKEVPFAKWAAGEGRPSM